MYGSGCNVVQSKLCDIEFDRNDKTHLCILNSCSTGVAHISECDVQ